MELEALIIETAKKIDTKELMIDEKEFKQDLVKKVATAINEKINLPFLNEEQEQKIFEILVSTTVSVSKAFLMQKLAGR